MAGGSGRAARRARYHLIGHSGRRPRDDVVHLGAEAQAAGPRDLVAGWSQLELRKLHLDCPLLVAEVVRLGVDVAIVIEAQHHPRLARAARADDVVPSGLVGDWQEPPECGGRRIARRGHHLPAEIRGKEFISLRGEL